MAPELPNNTPDELENVLPPAADLEAGEYDQGDDGQQFGGDDQAQAKTPPTKAQLEDIADKLIGGAAKAGSMTVPEKLRPEYERVFTKDELGLLRAGLHMTGATSALYELAPALGGAAAEGGAPGRPHPIFGHPVVRVLLGVGCLALASLVTRGQVNAKAQGHTDATVQPGSTAAAGGWGKSNSSFKG